MLPSAQHAVPDMDLWVPARQGTSGPCAGGAWGRPGRPAASPSPPRGTSGVDAGPAAWPAASAPAQEAGRAHAPSGTRSSSASAVGCPGSADAAPSGSEVPADEVGHRPQRALDRMLSCLGVTRLVLGLRPLCSWAFGSNTLSSLNRTFVPNLFRGDCVQASSRLYQDHQLSPSPCRFPLKAVHALSRALRGEAARRRGALPALVSPEVPDGSPCRVTCTPAQSTLGVSGPWLRAELRSGSNRSVCAGRGWRLHSGP